MRCRSRYDLSAEECPLDGNPLVDLPDPMVGCTLGGRYLVMDRIGSGGMATVYRAHSETSTGRSADVAIKILAEDLARDPVQRERFIREARATHRVKHPHIVDVLDYGVEGGLAYLVMELLEGMSLATRLSRGPLSPREAVLIVAQVTEALGRAHDVKIVHRDVKPENIFLCGRGPTPPLVKVLDFGLAHIRDEDRLTVSGAVFGTPEYMSPEMARGARCSPASDLYALGVTFFELLTGRRPFDGSLAELIEQHLDHDAPSLRDVAPDVPDVLEPVVRRLLAKTASERYRDADHLADDLTAVLHSLPPDPPAVEAFSQRTSPSSRRAFDLPSIRVWSDRVTGIRAAVTAAYPGLEGPAWIRDSISRLDEAITHARTLAAEIRQLADELDRREASARADRERLTLQLARLSREESAILRELDTLTRQRLVLRSEGDRALSELLRGWEIKGEEAHAVARAKAWQQIRLEEEQIAAAISERRRATSDLAHRVSMVHGEIERLDALTDNDVTVLRAALEARSLERGSVVERLKSVAASLTEHLRALPAARQVLEAARLWSGTVPQWGGGGAPG